MVMSGMRSGPYSPKLLATAECLLAGGGTSCGGDDGHNSSSQEEAHSIFDMTMDLSMIQVAVSMTCIIFFSIFIETILHRLEHHLKPYTQYTRLLKKMYQEIMTLGVISLTLFALVQSGAIAHTSPFYAPIEYCHFLIFIVAITFIAQGVMYTKIMSMVVQRWDVLATQKIPEIEQLLLAEQKMSICNPCSFLAHHDLTIYQGVCAKESVEFRILRCIFLKLHGIPSGFDFSHYLHNVCMRQIADMMHIHWIAWIFIATALWANYARYELFHVTGSQKAGDDSAVGFMCMGYLLFACTVGLGYYSHRMLSNVIKKFGFVNQNSEGMRKSLKVTAELISDHDREEEEQYQRVGEFQELVRDKAMLDYLGHRRASAHVGDLSDMNKKAESRPSDAHGFVIEGVEDDGSTDRIKWHKEEMKGIDKSPETFQRVIDCVVLLKCFYIAIYIMQYLRHSGKASRPDDMYTHGYGLPLVPYLLMTFVTLPVIVKNYSVIRAIVHLEPVLIGATMELSVRTDVVKADLRQRFLQEIYKTKKDSSELSESDVHRFFQGMDVSHDGSLSASELRNHLATQNLFFSESTFAALLRSIDSDKNGSISVAEFHQLIDPSGDSSFLVPGGAPGPPGSPEHRQQDIDLVELEHGGV